MPEGPARPAAGETPGVLRGDTVFAPGRRLLTTGLVLTITFVGFESLAVATVLPDVRRDLGGVALYGWVFSAFMLGSLIGIVLAGARADAAGPARPFVLALALFCIGLAAGGLAPSMIVLVVARFVQGLGGGAIAPIAYVAIGRAFPTSVQPRVFAILSSAWVLPGLIGPAIAGAIGDHASWRFVFLGLLPLVVPAGLVTLGPLMRIPPHPDEHRRAARLSDAFAVTAGTGLVLAGASIHAIYATAPLAIAGGAVAIPAFVRLVPSGTVRLAPGLPAAVALRGLLMFAFFGTEAYVPLALTEVRHTSSTVAGLALTTATLMWTAGAWVQERTVARVGPRRLGRVGFGLLVIGIAGSALALSSAVPVAVFSIVWGIAGLGVGLVYSPLTLTVLASAPLGQEGSASASLELAGVLGIALGTGIGGALVAFAASVSWSERRGVLCVDAIAAVVAFASLLGAARLPREISDARGRASALGPEVSGA
jgi:MFS family permease